MKKNLMASTLSLFILAVASPALSATFSEQPVNNDQITSAQNLGNITGDNTIDGSLSATPFDDDLFAISLQSGSKLAVSVNDPTLDTQLFLFNTGGFGLTGNDDSGNLAFNPSFSFTASTNGVYYLGITGSNYDPVDSAGNFIFSDNTTGNFSVTSVESLAGWALRDPLGLSPVFGNYTIKVNITPPTTSVPEPSAFLGLFAWIGCMAQGARKRRITS